MTMNICFSIKKAHFHKNMMSKKQAVHWKSVARGSLHPTKYHQTNCRRTNDLTVHVSDHTRTARLTEGSARDLYELLWFKPFSFS